jgi:hypothetical protein
MNDALRTRLLAVLEPFRTVHLYAAQPGALAMMGAVRPVLEAAGRMGRWFTEGWAATQAPDGEAPDRLEAPPAGSGAQCLMLGSQTSYPRTREMLRRCRALGLATAFVFDTWKNYAEHFFPETGAPVFPDLIFTPDAIASAGLHQALAARRHHPGAGSLPAVIEAGHWAIEAALDRLRAEPAAQVAARRAALCPDRRPVVLILLDPLPKPGDPDLGYDALDALAAMADAVAAGCPGACLLVKPHPREEPDRLAPALAAWRRQGLECRPVAGPPEALIAIANQVWGMTTTALLIAQAAGKPIRSFQPHRSAAGAAASLPHLEPWLATVTASAPTTY